MALNQCPNKQGNGSKRFWGNAIGGLMMHYLADRTVVGFDILVMVVAH
jgi:hypothetical protein